MASKNIVDITYQQWLATLKEKIRNSQLKAALKVNTEMLELYWAIGKELTEKQEQSNWGDKIITQLAKDLSSEFPEAKGFSRSNIFNIVKWYRFYAASPQLVQQAVGLIQKKGQQAADQIVQQPVGLLPVLLGQVPWGHHIQIITKAANPAEAIFYVQQTIHNNWSRAVLLQQIETGLYHRTGTAITNFELTLPKAQGDLARETLKNPYSFDFLGFSEAIQERELEKALIQHMKKFLLELGRGFAYVGNQYNLVVEDDDYYLDLLFYNYHLHCFVVFELKVGAFKPEFAGKLNFYINTVNQQIKGAEDKATIGVLLCKTPNDTVVKYSLQGIDAPMGVSEYELTKALPKQLKGEMPSIKELEAELEKEIEIILKPIDEKKNKLKEILSKIKGAEVKKERDKEALLYIFNEVLWKIKEHAEIILKEEMELFSEARINRSINGSTFNNATSADLDTRLLKENIIHLGIDLHFEGFKKAGTRAFGIYIDLYAGIEKYKYSIGETRDRIWKEYLYDHQWTADEIIQTAEHWSELIIDEIARMAQQVL